MLIPVNLHVVLPLYPLDMDILNNLNESIETQGTARDQIHYYSYMPKHIKGTAIELIAKSNSESQKPAYVVGDSVTVKGGRLNMPNLLQPSKLPPHIFS